MKPRICDACETVSHCSRHGCIPVQIERTGGNQGRDDPAPLLTAPGFEPLAPWLAGLLPSLSSFGALHEHAPLSRTMAEAFPHGPEYGCAIERPAPIGPRACCGLDLLRWCCWRFGATHERTASPVCREDRSDRGETVHLEREPRDFLSRSKARSLSVSTSWDLILAGARWCCWPSHSSLRCLLRRGSFQPLRTP